MELNTRTQKMHILSHKIKSISPWRESSLVYKIYTSENSVIEAVS